MHDRNAVVVIHISLIVIYLRFLMLNTLHVLVLVSLAMLNIELVRFNSLLPVGGASFEVLTFIYVEVCTKC